MAPRPARPGPLAGGGRAYFWARRVPSLTHSPADANHFEPRVPLRTCVVVEVLVVLLRRCRHQLVKGTLEATAARRRDGKKPAIEALADGFGHAACTMTDTIDRTDDGVAACNHFFDTVQAILDAAIMMQECRDPRRRRCAQVRNHCRAPSKVKDAMWGWCAPGLMIRNGPPTNVVGSKAAHGASCCGKVAQLRLSLACASPRHDECALALSKLLLPTTKAMIRLGCAVPQPRGAFALTCQCLRRWARTGSISCGESFELGRLGSAQARFQIGAPMLGLLQPVGKLAGATAV